MKNLIDEDPNIKIINRLMIMKIFKKLKKKVFKMKNKAFNSNHGFSTSNLWNVFSLPLKLILALRHRRDFAPTVLHRLVRGCLSGDEF